MEADRRRALEILRAHGADATSFQLLEPGYRYFFAEEGFVAYVDTGWAWVAGGGPVASPARIADVARAFSRAARDANRRPSFFAVSGAFCTETGMRHLRIGEQPFWRPATWDVQIKKHASLRYQLRRAQRHGVSVRRLEPAEVAPGAPMREAIDRLARAWVEAKPLAPMGFLVELSLWEHVEERLYLVAERQGTVVGFLGAVPVFAKRGWLVEDLLRDRSAPNGTAELLVDHAMRAAADGGAEVVTLGLAPLAGDVRRRLRFARAIARPIFDFRGLYAFKAKLGPDGWEPLYVASDVSPWFGLFDGLTAFARGSMLRFGLATLARGPTAVLWALTALLAVWTPALALAPTRRWFPSPHVQHAWIAFDLLLAAGLVALCLRYRSWLALLLATAVTTDAALTLAEAVAFNAPHARGLLDLVVVLIACTGPTVGAIALWGHFRRSSNLRRRR